MNEPIGLFLKLAVYPVVNSGMGCGDVISVIRTDISPSLTIDERLDEFYNKVIETIASLTISSSKPYLIYYETNMIPSDTDDANELTLRIIDNLINIQHVVVVDHTTIGIHSGSFHVAL